MLGVCVMREKARAGEPTGAVMCQEWGFAGVLLAMTLRQLGVVQIFDPGSGAEVNACDTAFVANVLDEAMLQRDCESMMTALNLSPRLEVRPALPPDRTMTTTASAAVAAQPHISDPMWVTPLVSTVGSDPETGFNSVRTTLPPPPPPPPHANGGGRRRMRQWRMRQWFGVGR
jgi:hypothetical protein